MDEDDACTCDECGRWAAHMAFRPRPVFTNEQASAVLRHVMALPAAPLQLGPAPAMAYPVFGHKMPPPKPRKGLYDCIGRN